MPDHPLGRLENFDERSRAFPIRALLTTTIPRSYTWTCLPRLDQGQQGSCVGHAWAHEIAARPKVEPADHALALKIYNRAQATDPWPNTPPEEGTSVLDGVKAATEFGYYAEYRWAFSITDLMLAVGYKGPAVLGIPWLQDMFDPDADGLLHATGPVAGGHAILCNGVSISKQRFRLHNSWGAWWGLNGEAFISFNDLEMLLHQGGEACVPVRRL